MQVFIDEPLPIKPLSEALYMGKAKLIIKEDDDDEMVSREGEEMLGLT